MRITSGFKKLIPSILGGAVGIALFIYSGQDDSPGGKVLSLVIFIVSMVVMYRTRKRVMCDVKK